MSGGAFSIRRTGAGDASRLAEVHAESIRTLGKLHYPAPIVEAWVKPCVPRRYLDRMQAGEVYLLAETAEGERPALGFSSWRFEGGRHRTAVYVAGRAARSGVGSALFHAAESLARENGATEVHVDASVGSVGFYRAVGFEELGRGMHIMRTGGEMECVFMRKALDGASRPR